MAIECKYARAYAESLFLEILCYFLNDIKNCGHRQVDACRVLLLFEFFTELIENLKTVKLSLERRIPAVIANLSETDDRCRSE